MKYICGTMSKPWLRAKWVLILVICMSVESISSLGNKISVLFSESVVVVLVSLAVLYVGVAKPVLEN